MHGQVDKTGRGFVLMAVSVFNSDGGKRLRLTPPWASRSTPTSSWRYIVSLKCGSAVCRPAFEFIETLVEEYDQKIIDAAIKYSDSIMVGRICRTHRAGKRNATSRRTRHTTSRFKTFNHRGNKGAEAIKDGGRVSGSTLTASELKS